MSFLRGVKFGGGIPVQIERNCHDNPNCQRIIDSHLYLRTSKFFILYDVNTKGIDEIPISDVMKVSYINNALWKLPGK